MCGNLFAVFDTLELLLGMFLSAVVLLFILVLPLPQLSLFCIGVPQAYCYRLSFPAIKTQIQLLC